MSNDVICSAVLYIKIMPRFVRGLLSPYYTCTRIVSVAMPSQCSEAVLHTRCFYTQGFGWIKQTLGAAVRTLNSWYFIRATTHV